MEGVFGTMNAVVGALENWPSVRIQKRPRTNNIDLKVITVPSVRGRCTSRNENCGLFSDVNSIN